MKKPKFFDRVANVLGYIKEVAVAPLSNNRVPVPPMYKQTDYLKAYNGWVYACVKARAQDFARIQLHLYRTIDRDTGEVEEIKDHNVLSLMRKVNSWMTRRQLFEYTQAYRDLAGEAFWLLVRANGKPDGEILQIWLLRPDWIQILPDPSLMIRGYRYMVPGYAPIDFMPSEIIHFKEFNPVDIYRGLSVVGAAAVTIDSENFAEQYNRKFFENSATPSAVLKTEQKLDTKLKNRMREEWQNEFGGRDKAHRIAILEGGLELQPYSVSQRDMEFLQGQQYSRDKIMAIFQTPKTVLGMTEGVTVSNADATDYVFQKRVVLPLMEKFRDDINEFLLPQYKDLEDCFFDFESPVPQMLETELLKYEKLFNIGAMTQNEIRQAQGMDEEPGLDTYYLPLNMQPIAQDDDVAGDDALVDDDQNAEKKPHNVTRFKYKGSIPPPRLNEKLKKEITEKVQTQVGDKIKGVLKAQFGQSQINKDASNRDISSDIGRTFLTEKEQDSYWAMFDTKAASYEKPYIKAITQIMAKQEAETIDRLNKVRKGVGIKDVGSDIQKILFSISQENKASATIIVPILTQLIEDAGSEALDLLGVPKVINTNSAAIGKFLANDALLGVKSMNGTTRNALKNLLATSFATGLSNDQTARKITEYFQGIGKTRATTIARTETIKASNFATLEAYKQSDVVIGKQWYTAQDERVCPQCGPMDGVVLGLDSNFFDKGDSQHAPDGQQYSYDYESIDTPPLHANCRCTVLPVTKY